MPGRSIKIFLVDGSPNGLRTAEIGLSSVMAIVVPRASLSEFVKGRPESKKTGVYVLSGDSTESPGRQEIYVGEADETGIRLLEHDRDLNKDFWDLAMVFITKDLSLTKAHARHLEAKLIEVARAVKRAIITNATNPVGGSLPESDVSDMIQMLDQIKLLSTTMGLPAFDETLYSSPLVSDPGSIGQQLENKFAMSGDGYSAVCIVNQGQFIVQENSIGRLKVTDSFPQSARLERHTLLKSGVIEKTESGYRFTQDYPFDSATKSAQVICGFPVNGRAAWYDQESQKSYGDWLDEISVDE